MNRVKNSSSKTTTTVKPILKILSILAILVQTIAFNACSDGGDEGGGGTSFEYSESYAIKSIDESDGIITYLEPRSPDWECKEGGVLEDYNKDREPYEIESAYSINNNVLAVWLDAYDRDSEKYKNDSLNFKGTSNNIIGAWARNKNKAASCEMIEDRWCIEYDDNWECSKYETEEYLHCKYGYDIVKLDISQKNLKVTRDICIADEIGEGTDKDGVKTRIIDCNTIEGSKGNEKVTVKYEFSNGKYISANLTYNGKTCKYKEGSAYTESELKKFCVDANSKCQANNCRYLDDYFWDAMITEFRECAKDFPEWFFGDDGDDDYEGRAVLAKKSSVPASAKKEKKAFGLLKKRR